jgi:hypothetical protein
MTKLARHALTVSLVVCAMGCATQSRSPVPGYLYSNVKTAGNVTENTIEQRSKTVCSKSALGWFGWGSSAVASAAGASGQISIVDGEEHSFLGLYGKHCSVVHAGTNEIALEDEPEDPTPPPPPPGAGTDARPGETPPRVVYPVGPSGASPGPTGTAGAATTAPTHNPTPEAKVPWHPSDPAVAPHVDAPGGWPDNVPISDRTACTLVCMENAVAAEGSQVEVVINRQLGALRACAQRTNEFHAVSSAITFGPDGRMMMSVNTHGMKPQMRECIARIPAPGYFHGPANTRWKCTDYCR